MLGAVEWLNWDKIVKRNFVKFSFWRKQQLHPKFALIIFPKKIKRI